MENTSSFLFDNNDAKFFVALKGKAFGPLTAQEIYERIQRAEIGLMHYIWCEGWSEWKRIGDEKEFIILIPQKPSTQSIQYIKEKMARAQSKKSSDQNHEPLLSKNASSISSQNQTASLYLYFNGTQYGPFTKQELEVVLKKHKLNRQAYLWTPGWPNWKKLVDMPEYQSFFKDVDREAKAAKEDRSEPSVGRSKSKKSRTGSISKSLTKKTGSHSGADPKDKRRTGPRRPLVARLFLHNDKEVIIAVCRDISVGGMQVLTDRVPGPVGSHIKLNVSTGDPSIVKSFVAEGEIVRVLEDGRGFSFRFKKISDEAKKAILKYIKSDL